MLSKLTVGSRSDNLLWQNEHLNLEMGQSRGMGCMMVRWVGSNYQ